VARERPLVISSASAVSVSPWALEARLKAQSATEETAPPWVTSQKF
jgi:hypothetical protein